MPQQVNLCRLPVASWHAWRERTFHAGGAIHFPAEVYRQDLALKATVSGRVRVINLEEGFPTRDQTYQKLEGALTRARKENVAVLKVIHGYGSTGAGGVLRFAIRGFLRQRKERGEIAAFVNGESWSSFEARSKEMLARVPELLLDSDLGGGNKGITLVLL